MNTTVHHDHCFGELLRQEREQRGVSLDWISASTKVAVRNLQALEAERFDQLPGGILNKGIVRGYVRCLGLDENEWIRRYLDASQEPVVTPESKDWASFALNISNNRISSEHRTHLRWTGVGVLLLLLASFGWFVWSYIHTRTASAQHTAVSSSYADNTDTAGRTSHSRTAPLAATYPQK
ncbi:MAG TPA: helix-turn-helix transcriptional regulator [Acidobacteriaceae bacterium]|nr:helix-turn-helix transcriptional regulator [Acidobacteriaceae bacterium]